MTEARVTVPEGHDPQVLEVAFLIREKMVKEDKPPQGVTAGFDITCAYDGGDPKNPDIYTVEDWAKTNMGVRIRKVNIGSWIEGLAGFSSDPVIRSRHTDISAALIDIMIAQNPVLGQQVRGQQVNG